MVKKEMIDGTPLKFIGHIGGTVQEIVEKEVFENGIVVCSANKAFGRTLAEYNLMLHLMAARKAYEYINKMKTGEIEWLSNFLCVDGIIDKTIGIIGYGSITKELIKILKPFNVRILLYSRHCSLEEAESLGVKIVSLKELLSVSDAVNIESTLTDSTYHMLNKEALAYLKDGAILVNAARGGIVDQDALINELKNGRIFAALDVFEEEPLLADSQLRTLPNVILFPHMGGKTYECRENMAAIIIEQVINYIKGSVVEEQVTVEQYLRMSKKIKKVEHEL